MGYQKYQLVQYINELRQQKHITLLSNENILLPLSLSLSLLISSANSHLYRIILATFYLSLIYIHIYVCLKICLISQYNKYLSQNFSTNCFSFPKMESLLFSSNWVFKFFFINLQIIVFYLGYSFSNCFSSTLHPLIANSREEHRNYTAISDFRLINRRFLGECQDLSPYQKINVSSNVKHGDEEFVTVTVSGVLFPSEHDWVAMISPSHAK